MSGFGAEGKYLSGKGGSILGRNKSIIKNKCKLCVYECNSKDV